MRYSYVCFSVILNLIYNEKILLLWQGEKNNHEHFFLFLFFTLSYQLNVLCTTSGPYSCWGLSVHPRWHMPLLFSANEPTEIRLNLFEQTVVLGSPKYKEVQIKMINHGRGKGKSAVVSVRPEHAECCPNGRKAKCNQALRVLLENTRAGFNCGSFCPCIGNLGWDLISANYNDY